MTKTNPEFMNSAHNGAETLSFRGLTISRGKTDLRQDTVTVTVRGAVVYNETKASKQVNAATKMMRALVRLKNERKKLMDLKAKAGRVVGADTATLDSRLKLLNDEFKLVLARAPLDGVPADWLLAVDPKASAA